MARDTASCVLRSNSFHWPPVMDRHTTNKMMASYDGTQKHSVTTPYPMNCIHVYHIMCTYTCSRPNDRFSLKINAWMRTTDLSCANGPGDGPQKCLGCCYTYPTSGTGCPNCDATADIVLGCCMCCHTYLNTMCAKFQIGYYSILNSQFH